MILATEPTMFRMAGFLKSFRRTMNQLRLCANLAPNLLSRFPQSPRQRYRRRPPPVQHQRLRQRQPFPRPQRSLPALPPARPNGWPNTMMRFTPPWRKCDPRRCRIANLNPWRTT
jgi:hypothetical protein